MVVMCDRIRRARLTSGLSQTQLAAQTGVQRSAVAQWERDGGTSPSVPHLARIAVVTQVYFEWLATGRGPGRPDDGSELPLPESVVEPTHDPQEREILALLRRMPPRKRQVARAIIEMLND